MIKINKDDPIFYERYRPQTVDDLIIPETFKKKLKSDIENNTIPHMAFFSNEPGTGKTSTAKSILRDIGGEAIFINSSLEKGIDVLRGKILDFVTSGNSFDGSVKVVVLDECDSLSEDTQKAFRGVIEEYARTCRFIITGNYKEKMIPAILNRFEVYDFNAFPKAEMVKPIFQRLEYILGNENISYEKQDLVTIINTFYPSIREMVKSLQKYSGTGKLILNTLEIDQLDVCSRLLELIKKKDYNNMVIEANKINSPSSFYKESYKKIDLLNDKIKAPFVITLAKYQNMDISVRDKNLNLAACCFELMNLFK